MPEEMIDVGVRHIDEEHRVQFHLLEGIQHEVENSRRDNVLALLQQFYDYSRAHFATEETFMRLQEYPGRVAHEREHRELLHELQMLIDGATSHDALEIAGWPQAIRRWLMSHISTADVAYGRWVLARQQ